MKFEIYPYTGAGKLKLGMTQNDVRQVLSSPFRSFKRNFLSKMPLDCFDDVGVYVHYKPPGIVEAMEFFGDSEPLIDGVNLLKTPVKDIYKMILRDDPELADEDESFTSYKLGVGVYSPSGRADYAGHPEAIIVFEKGYYN